MMHDGEGTKPAGAGGRSAADLKQEVRETYAAHAVSRHEVAETIYPAAELADLPTRAVELALGFGHPARDAELVPGETVLDLGCGGGIDSLLAARRVGPTGRVIGVDFTPEMLSSAQRSVQEAQATQVTFLLADGEALPLAEASVDAAFANGSLNLVPDKDRVLAEIYRVLRPGGRLVLAELMVNGELPPEILAIPKLWGG